MKISADVKRTREIKFFFRVIILIHLIRKKWNMISSFADLGIAPPILKAIEEIGFETPTEVQARAIPHILNKEDLIVMSKTGSGKTAVFGVSMLQLIDPGVPGPQGLILTPTRELAVQIDSDLKQFAKHISHRTTAIYGQHSMNTEIQALGRGVSIVTGTPGRVYDHIQHGTLDTSHVSFLVLDEADRMLDMGFFDQVVRIVKTLPKDRVTLLFSATIPTEIRRICRDYMKQPKTVEIESPTMTVDTIDQLYYRVERNEKRTQLNRVLLMEQPESCMIFCNTRAAVDQVKSFLNKKGYAAQALHGEIPQARRMKTIEQFKRGDYHMLVATDVAARGLHVEDLSLVVNYDVPNEKDNYIHRIGRTGRAGKTGRAITLVTGDDIMSLYEIEEHIGTTIIEKGLPDEAAFKDASANAEVWIKENAVKVVPYNRYGEGETGRNSSGQKRSRPKQSRNSQQNRTSAGQQDRQNRGYQQGINAEGSEEIQNKSFQQGSKAAGRQDRQNRGYQQGNKAIGREDMQNRNNQQNRSTVGQQNRQSRSYQESPSTAGRQDKQSQRSRVGQGYNKQEGMNTDGNKKEMTGERVPWSKAANYGTSGRSSSGSRAASDFGARTGSGAATGSEIASSRQESRQRTTASYGKGSVTGSRYNGANAAASGSSNPRYNKDSRQQGNASGYQGAYGQRSANRYARNNSSVNQATGASANNSAAQSKPGQMQSQQEKKPLLKRLVQKLFGK